MPVQTHHIFGLGLVHVVGLVHGARVFLAEEMGQDTAVNLTLWVAERLLHPPVEFRLRLLHSGQVGRGQHVPGAGSLAGVMVQHLA